MDKRALIATSVLALTLGAFCTSAQARSIPGIVGHPGGDGDPSCFVEDYGSIRNVCGGFKLWVTALPVDPDGVYSANYFVRVPSGGGVSCTTWGISSDFTKTSSGNIDFTNTTGATVTKALTPGSVTVPFNGHMFGGCWLSTNAQLLHTTY